MFKKRILRGRLSVDGEIDMLTINHRGKEMVVEYELLEFLNKKIRITIEEVE